MITTKHLHHSSINNYIRRSFYEVVADPGAVPGRSTISILESRPVLISDNNSHKWLRVQYAFDGPETGFDVAIE